MRLKIANGGPPTRGNFSALSVSGPDLRILITRVTWGHYPRETRPSSGKTTFCLLVLQLSLHFIHASERLFTPLNGDSHVGRIGRPRKQWQGRERKY